MKHIFKTGLAVVLLVMGARHGLASQVFIPGAEVETGKTIEIPLMLDEVDNLAGVKVVITYDSKLMTFKKAEKSKYTTPLMHIVNDKTPGTLIVVMAAARGIKGKNFPIFHMTFEAQSGLMEKQLAQFEIKEVQLMSDALKDIPYTIKTDPVTILPLKSEKGSDKPKNPKGDKNKKK